MSVYLDFGDAIEDNSHQAIKDFFAKWPAFAMTTAYNESRVTPLILAIIGAADKIVENLLSRPDIKLALYQTDIHCSTCLEITVAKLSFEKTQADRDISQRCWRIVQLLLKADAQFRTESTFCIAHPIALKDIKNDIGESAMDVAQSCKDLLRHHLFILVNRYFLKDEQARAYLDNPAAKELMRNGYNTEFLSEAANNPTPTTQAAERTGSWLYSTLTNLFGVFSSGQPASTSRDYQLLPTQSSSPPSRAALLETSSGYKPKAE